MYVAQERRAYILRILQQRGSIRSATIARELGVTDETIRTDLVDMQAQGLLKRTHGGARYILPTPGSDSSARPDCQLAALAAAHIKPGMCIYLDNDPLALVLVSQLGDIPCTLVSNSPELLARLSTSPLPQQIICTGGTLDKECGILDSPTALASLEQEHRPDIALLIPPAVRSDVAAYHHPLRTTWARAAAEASRKCIIMVPAQALHAHARHAMPLPAGNTLITENNLPANFNHPDTELIPYISAEELLQASEFDY
jgi:DeoR/GlpR family transcriptional regulator of sugar metabolism